jgi:3-dehydroquinate synthase
MQIKLNNGIGGNTEIYIGSDSLQILDVFLSALPSGTGPIFILADDQTRFYCLEKLTTAVPSLLSSEVLEIKAGEKNKSITSLDYLWSSLSEKGASRHSLIINLGGGVITDLGGFVASTFNRGIPFINIPTSLLGMVDAAVGGKTGINLGNIKNQVGTFQEPIAVFMFTGFLQSLHSDELINGFAEIIKIALVADSRLWEKLKLIHFKDLLIVSQNEEKWEDLITSAVIDKCQIVEQDFREKNLREILNFGHTIGHAFESLSLCPGRKPISHGHAIALGMVCESYLSCKKAGLDTQDRDAIVKSILKEYEYYPLQLEDIKLMMDFMGRDKKRQATGLRFSLISSPGKAIIGHCCDTLEIIESIDFYRTFEG